MCQLTRHRLPVDVAGTMDPPPPPTHRNIGRWLSAICLAIQTCSALKAAGVDVPNVRYASAGFVWFCGVGLCLGAFQNSFVLVRFYKGF